MDLTIPKNQEQHAIALAKAANCRILFDPVDNIWIVSGKNIPEELQRFSQSKPSKSWVLDVPFQDRNAATALGAKWQPKKKVFVYTGTSLPIGLSHYVPLPYSWEEKKSQEITDVEHEANQGTGEIKLHPHQVVAKLDMVKAIKTNQPGYLLADDVGLGKTFSTWSAILDGFKQPQRILIVAPLAVLPVWREALYKLGDGGHDVLILNYHKLNKLFELDPGKKAKSLKGLARKGTADQYDVIIWDESHYLKSMVSNSPAARANLAKKLYTGTKFMIWLSATAGQDLLEIGYLYPLLKTGTIKSMPDWAKQHGFKLEKGEFGKWLWEPSPEDEEKLSKMLFSPTIGMRRLPQAIAGWPEINRILQPIEMSASEAAMYDLAWKEFIKAMKLDRDAGKVSLNGLTATLRLRQKASIIKVPHTLDFTETLLNSDRKVAISFEFLDSLQAVSEGLHKKKVAHSIITGKTDKEAERLRFQKGTNRVVLFSVKEGISLHEGQYIVKDKPRSQIVHDLRWSGIDQHQIDGRSHRDGKYCPIYWMLLRETIEQKVANALLKRLKSMAVIHGDEKDVLKEIWDQL